VDLRRARIWAAGATQPLSAAAHRGLWGTDGEKVDVTAPRGRHPQPGIALHRPRELPDRHEHRGIPITSPTRILLDLATTFTAANLDRAIGEAEILGLLDADELRRRGGPKLRRLLDSHDDSRGIPRNVMERAFRTIARSTDLPEPEANAELLGYEIDFLWRGLRIAVETDGRSVHARRAAFARDRRKDRDLQLGGYLALRFTYAEIVREPGTVRAALTKATRSQVAWEPSSCAAPESAAAGVRVEGLASHGLSLCDLVPRLDPRCHRANPASSGVDG
jgi:very-short-patch-repair endonuclease